MGTGYPPFVVTSAAVEQIEVVGGSVRVDVEAGGCSGSTYVFNAGPAGRSDLSYGCPGAVLAVSRAALSVLAGAKLDYSGRVATAAVPGDRQPELAGAVPVQPVLRRAWPGRGQPDCRATTPMPWNG